MFEKRKKQTPILNFIPLLLVILIISSILFSSASLLSFDPTLNNLNYNTALAFRPADQTPTTNDTATTAGITIDTDKIVYVAGESVVIDGKVDKVIEGKNVRLDCYDPDGKPITMVYKFMEPDETGVFSYSGLQSFNIPSDSKPGEYTLLATYNKKSVETKIMVK